MKLLDKIVAPYGTTWVLDRAWGVMQGSQYHSICVICGEDFFDSETFIVRVHPEQDMKMNRYACRDHFSAGGDALVHPQHLTMQRMRTGEPRDPRRGREHSEESMQAYARAEAARLNYEKISEMLRSLDERVKDLERRASVPF